jgi:hypothetical protein
MLPPPKSVDFPLAARRHMADAGLLDTQNRLPNGGHLYGYVAECGLKALLTWHGYPTDAEGSPIRLDGFKVHVDHQRLAQVENRMDRAYTDRLDGKISEEFWIRKSEEWQTEESQIRFSIRSLEVAGPERFLDAAKILELANKAYFLYVKQDHGERAKLLKIVLSNCRIDAVSLYPTYRAIRFDL